MPDKSLDLTHAPDAPAEDRTVAQQTPPKWLSGSATDAEDAPATAPAAGAERYERIEEIARGGMGMVWRAFDRVLEREVGVKTLLHAPQAGTPIASRFRLEARITGQLQHPNIPPVHDLGTLPDGRPFLAMKLIRGRTLDAELKDRPDPAHDRGRFLAVFEGIAQAVAYAHDQRIIHRDLKPLNVMVGAFGEVQVMDWGLAKVLGDSTQPAPPEVETWPADAPATQGEGDATRPGSIFGTPAYMPREQATGATDEVDERSDVFSLGGILCAILTGQPPYVGKNAETTRQLAAAAKLDGGLARLDACGAEPELIALCKRCLAPERGDRPRNAGEVALAVGALRADAEQRARQAELDRVRAEGDRARAEVQAAEQRKRRRVQLALLGAVVLLAAGAGGFAWWQDRQAADRKLADERAEAERLRIEVGRKAAEARAEAERLFKERQARQGASENLALAATLRGQHKFKEAAQALTFAAALARGAPELLPTVEQAQRDLAFAAQLDDIRYRKWLWIAEPGGSGTFNTRIASPEYRQAFADHGLPLDALEVAEAAQRISASGVKAELVAALDDWSLYEPEAELRKRLWAILRAADSDPWSDRLRDPAVRADKSAVAKLAADADPAATSPFKLSALAEVMKRRGLNPAPLLTAARVKHPSNFELAFALGQWHNRHGRDGRPLNHSNTDGQQIGPYEAARALRPENMIAWNNLGTAQHARGDLAGAAAAYREAIRLNPGFALSHNNLGVVLKDSGDLDGAIEACRQAIRLNPKYAYAHNNLGNALRAKGDPAGAVSAYRQAIQLDPKYASAHHNLGLALKQTGDRGGALAAFEEAARLDPQHAAARLNLGIALKDKGDVAGALAAFREAARLDPNSASAHHNLALALLAQGDKDGAVAALRRAVQLNPKDALAHTNLGSVLKERGDVNGAIASYKEAIKLDPKNALAHYDLGVTLRTKGDMAGAIQAYREAIKLNPKNAHAHTGLGLALRAKGEVAEAMAAFEEALTLNPNDGTAHLNLSGIYYNRKDYRPAVAHARSAVEAMPKYSNAHAMLGLALQHAGDLDGARAALTEATRLDKQWAKLLAGLPAPPVAPPPHEAKRP